MLELSRHQSQQVETRNLFQHICFQFLCGFLGVINVCFVPLIPGGLLSQQTHKQWRTWLTAQGGNKTTDKPTYLQSCRRWNYLCCNTNMYCDIICVLKQYFFTATVTVYCNNDILWNMFFFCNKSYSEHSLWNIKHKEKVIKAKVFIKVSLFYT